MSERQALAAGRTRVGREHLILISLAVTYFVAGRLGLAFSYGHPGVSLVWPPAGMALGAFLLLGYRIWPLIFGASLVVYASTLGLVPTVILLAGANTLEGLLATYLINRFAGGRHALQNPRDSLKFTGIVGLTVATVTATSASLALVLGHVIFWTDYGVVWLTVCLGSLVSMLVVTPAILLYSLRTHARIRPALVVEGIAALLTVVVVGLLVFYRAPLELRGFPHELLCLPALLWVVFRLGRRATVSALLILTTLSIFGTLGGYGPFVRTTPLASLIVVQLFNALSAAMTLSLAALAAEYAVAEAQLRELVVSDPLTGLPNYRRLLEVLTLEIARADRQGAQIAVVFFDMDGLKDINDAHGHLVGSRAVCRFAETLRAACRATDTPARYGGDEFVAVLSDTNQEGARLVVRRITERLAEEAGDLPLSVSAGIAVYPGDGGTPTTLLSAADRALYAVKAEKASARRRSVVGIREWTSVGTR